ncbi:hypothetical protein SAMN05216255_3672 [Pseudomonas segetis]|uniref:Uncharacterized protein n=1 Tax=Pseudomonas segetis TaxID=298908 RepID=A0A239HZN4_9PSED|nr:hypothetical protein SAMN05216255_3672 [Pseudomonas segetis]
MRHDQRPLSIHRWLGVDKVLNALEVSVTQYPLKRET